MHHSIRLQPLTPCFFQNFLPRLKDHVLARTRGLTYNGDEYDFTDDERECIVFHNNKIHDHPLLRVNYTTYDLRREQDTINPLSRADIMVLSQEDERTHPYWYARVVKIFHIMVEHREDHFSPFAKPARMDVLFVRWFQLDSNFNAGWDAKRLYRVQFFENDRSGDAFGFIDPNLVVRGVHLIPAFAYGETDNPEHPLGARLQDVDWRYSYVNMYVSIRTTSAKPNHYYRFVDRDMFMRFRGGGIGHKATRDWDQHLQKEGRVPRDYHDGDDAEEPTDAINREVDDGIDIGDEDEVDLDPEENEGQEDEGVDGDYENRLDQVVADEGEELDDDIWAQEGYGAL